ncbi:MAG: hypothetical protein Aurels2KO_20840 [Aureliella sp.]
MLAAILLSFVYMNASFFRFPMVTAIAVTLALGLGVFLFLFEPTRRPSEYLFLMLFFLADPNLGVGYAFYFLFHRAAHSYGYLDDDWDLRPYALLGFLMIAWTISHNGIVVSRDGGFGGRYSIGFYHPNLAALWGLILAYLCKHYLPKPFFLVGLVVAGASIFISGGSGKIPMLLFLAFSPAAFLFKRTVFYSTIALVLGLSVFFMTATDFSTTQAISGRNVIFDALLRHMDVANLFVGVSKDSLLSDPSVQSYYDDIWEDALPFDNILSAAAFISPLMSLCFICFTGVWRCPKESKDFDRVMLFWICGLAANPLSVWNPFFLLAIKGTSKDHGWIKW